MQLFTPAGSRYLKDGLVVPGRFKAMSNGKTLLFILKNELEKKAEKLKHIRLNDSAVKTINKILYFWNPVVLIRGGGWG